MYRARKTEWLISVDMGGSPVSAQSNSQLSATSAEPRRPPGGRGGGKWRSHGARSARLSAQPPLSGGSHMIGVSGAPRMRRARHGGPAGNGAGPEDRAAGGGMSVRRALHTLRWIVHADECRLSRCGHVDFVSACMCSGPVAPGTAPRGRHGCRSSRCDTVGVHSYLRIAMC